MSGLVIHSGHSQGISPRQIGGVLAASQVFDLYDPVGIVSDAIDEPPRDGTEILVADLFIGFAAMAARGVDAASRTGLTYGGGIEGGATTGSRRAFFPATDDLLMRTRNHWATGGTTREIPAGTARGLLREITFNSAAGFGVWGIENTAGVIGTDVVAEIMDVMDENYVSIATTDTTTGVWVVFRVVGNNQWQGSAAADPAAF